jgi:putative secretion ATPase (PEP-CTERM system associated)
MYTEFYKLRAEPFLLTPDHRFYFDSTVHSQAMAHLLYGVNRGEGFIIITGDVGAGKTTLVKHLCATLDARKITAAHVVTTLVAGSDLLRMVMASFGLKDIPSDKGSMLLRLQRFFETVNHDGRRALLIVDEAQNLTIEALEELRMLSNFQINNTAPFQAFLVGQPQFRTTLADPALEQLCQRVITSYHLGPMSRDEVAEYLSHRLLRVGWVNDPEFDDTSIDAVFRHTAGIPRRINNLSSRLLLLGFLDDLHRFTGEEVDKVANDMLAESASHTSASAHSANGNGTGNGQPERIAAALREVPDLITRIERIEERLSRQDDNLNRAAAVFRDFLKFAMSARDNNPV